MFLIIHERFAHPHLIHNKYTTMGNFSSRSSRKVTGSPIYVDAEGYVHLQGPKDSHIYVKTRKLTPSGPNPDDVTVYVRRVPASGHDGW